MKIAILGATSYIAKDFIRLNSVKKDFQLHLYVRNPKVLLTWLEVENLPSCTVKPYTEFNKDEIYSAIINFVGIGNPADAKSLGAQIFSITTQYDQMALRYLNEHPSTKYIFLSSGIAYGSNFTFPVDEFTLAKFDINNQSETDWYAKSKVYCELLHRSLSEFNIIDLRVFNYFSQNINLENRYLITDLLRGIKNKEHFYTNQQDIWRDYLHPNDFYQLVSIILQQNKINDVFDCYSLAPINKLSLLHLFQQRFGLQYSLIETQELGINATGYKSKYYSQNYKASSLGYKPLKNSYQCLEEEATLILNSSLINLSKSQNALA